MISCGMSHPACCTNCCGLYQVELGAGALLERVGNVSAAGRCQRAFLMPMQGSAQGIPHLGRQGIGRAALPIMFYHRGVLGERVSSLDHEAVYHAVEQQAVVVTAQGQFLEVVPVAGRILVQPYPDGAHGGDDVKDGLFRQSLGGFYGGHAVFGLQVYGLLGAVVARFASGYQGQYHGDDNYFFHRFVSFRKFN